ncbi:MAG: GspE/PulE family protein [Candidatus Falkowbacteria bacterium]|nr:GspE/PulE family protein [Candidatus Falkowbacteria bacterium]
MSKQKKILELLLKKNVISSDQAVAVLNEIKKEEKSIEELLLEKKISNSENLAQVKAEAYGLPYLNLTETEIGENTLNIIPHQVAENYKIICFEKINQAIKVGLTDPENFKAIEAVDFLAKEQGLIVEYFLISKESFKAAAKQYKSIAEELSTALKTRAAEELQDLSTVEEREEVESAEITKSAPVAKIVSVIIRHAIEGGASDIHIEPLEKETRVRYRIDGILHTSLILPHSVHAAIVARIKVMANLKLDESRLPQDGRIRLLTNDKEYDFRVSIMPLFGAEKVVMRILDTSKKAPTLEDLGYQGIQLEVIRRNLQKTEGMLLATGPTGSGKSTTLFSMLNTLNKEGVNIATLEDPVEYQIKGVNQSQVRPTIGFNFSSGLRSMLRQDPDVIMVGEIRDEETAELAVHSALTGHFVLSTLHTNSAASAITRLVDMKVEPFLLGSTLHTVIAQRLARKICANCKIESKMPAPMLKEISAEVKNVGSDYIKTIISDFNPDKLIFYSGKGCPRCGNTGYAGRVALVEVLDINEAIKEIIFSGKKYLSMEEIKNSQKFVTIRQDGIIKVLEGLTTMQEILRVISD